jgi:hypothetical protein
LRFVPAKVTSKTSSNKIKINVIKKVGNDKSSLLHHTPPELEPIDNIIDEIVKKNKIVTESNNIEVESNSIYQVFFQFFDSIFEIIF